MPLVERKELLKQVDEPLAAALPTLEKRLKVIASGTAVATRKGRDLVPEADFALAVRRAPVEGLAYEEYPVSRGYLLLTCEGLGLGFVKNLGNRTNSLLPSNRRIHTKLP